MRTRLLRISATRTLRFRTLPHKAVAKRKDWHTNLGKQACYSCNHLCGDTSMEGAALQ